MMHARPAIRNASAKTARRSAPTSRIVVGENQALQNVFVYVKDGLGSFGFPIPSEPVVLDQDKCRYTPRVLGVRVGQPLQIRNSDPLLHNVRVERRHQPGLQQVDAARRRELQAHVRDAGSHGAVQVRRARLDDARTSACSIIRTSAPTAPDGKVVLGNLPPGTYTIEAWHETLGTKTQQVTIAAKESKDVSFTFAR